MKQAFINTYYPFAKQTEEKTGVPALFALAQSALESGWGKHAPKNMLFGIKVGSGRNFGGWNGDRQLITTSEYSNKSTLNFPFIYDGFPKRLSSGKWHYKIKDYFRAYPSPLNSFLDWAGLLSKASRYAKAMQNKSDPYRFAEEVAKAGYATDPSYANKIKSIMRDIEKDLPKTVSTQNISNESDLLNKAKKNILPVVLLLLGTSIVAFTLLKNR